MRSILVPAHTRRMIRRALPVECEIVTEGDYRVVGRRGVDLSLEGMLVECEKDLGVGENVLVAFRAPRTQLWFYTGAEVARLVRGFRDTDVGRQVGLRFTQLDNFARTVLTTSLRGVPPPVPARLHRVDYAATVRQIALSS